MTVTSNDVASKPAETSLSHRRNNDVRMATPDNTRTKQVLCNHDSRMTTPHDSDANSAQLSKSLLHQNDIEMTTSDDTRRTPAQSSKLHSGNKDDSAVTSMSKESTSKAAKESSSTLRHADAVSDNTVRPSVMQNTSSVTHSENNRDKVIDGAKDNKHRDQNIRSDMKPPTVTVTAEVHNQPTKHINTNCDSPSASNQQFKVHLVVCAKQ